MRQRIADSRAQPIKKNTGLVKIKYYQGKEYLEWCMKDFFDGLQVEVDLQECHKLSAKDKDEDPQRRRRKARKASG